MRARMVAASVPDASERGPGHLVPLRLGETLGRARPPRHLVEGASGGFRNLHTGREGSHQRGGAGGVAGSPAREGPRGGTWPWPCFPQGQAEGPGSTLPSAFQQQPHPCLVPFGGQAEAARPTREPCVGGASIRRPLPTSRRARAWELNTECWPLPWAGKTGVWGPAPHFATHFSGFRSL